MPKEKDPYELLKLSDRDFAAYLRGLNDPVESARLAKSYLTMRGESTSTSPEVTTYLSNVVPELLLIIYEYRKSEQGNQ